MGRMNGPCLCGDPACQHCFPQAGGDPIELERARIARMHDAEFREYALEAFKRIYAFACRADDIGDGSDLNNDILERASAFVPSKERERIERVSAEMGEH